MKPIVVVDKIMETANRLFYEQGYNSTGINQIIEEAGISKPSLYNHFRSKNDLLLAYLDQQDREWFNGLTEFSKKVRSPFEKVMAIFDYRIKRQVASKYKGCPWNKVASEVSAEETIVFERVSRFKTDLKTHIENLVIQMNRPKDVLLNDAEFVDLILAQLEFGVLMAHQTKSHYALQQGKIIVRKLA